MDGSAGQATAQGEHDDRGDHRDLERQVALGRGLIEDAVLLGAALPASAAAFERVRGVVGGRLVNGYSRKDWVLRFLYRYQSWDFGVAGVAPVAAAGVENVDVSEIDGVPCIERHLDYPEQTSRILRAIGLEGGSGSAGADGSTGSTTTAALSD